MGDFEDLRLVNGRAEDNLAGRQYAMQELAGVCAHDDQKAGRFRLPLVYRLVHDQESFRVFSGLLLCETKTRCFFLRSGRLILTKESRSELKDGNRAHAD